MFVRSFIFNFQTILKCQIISRWKEERHLKKHKTREEKKADSKRRTTERSEEEKEQQTRDAGKWRGF